MNKFLMNQITVLKQEILLMKSVYKFWVPWIC